MHQSGLIHKWTSDGLPRKNLCKEKIHERHNGGDQSGDIEGQATNREVKLDDMQGSFFLLFIGKITYNTNQCKDFTKWVNAISFGDDIHPFNLNHFPSENEKN